METNLQMGWYVQNTPHSKPLPQNQTNMEKVPYLHRYGFIQLVYSEIFNPYSNIVCLYSNSTSTKKKSSYFPEMRQVDSKIQLSSLK